MAKTAKVLHIQEMEEDDHIQAQHSKTLVGDGEFSVPTVDQIDEWAINLIKMPKLHWGCIFSYLISNCGWGNQRVKDFDEDDGYKLCEAKHIYGTVMSEGMTPTPRPSGSTHRNTTNATSAAGSSSTTRLCHHHLAIW